MEFTDKEDNYCRCHGQRDDVYHANTDESLVCGKCSLDIKAIRASISRVVSDQDCPPSKESVLAAFKMSIILRSEKARELDEAAIKNVIATRVKKKGALKAKTLVRTYGIHAIYTVLKTLIDEGSFLPEAGKGTESMMDARSNDPTGMFIGLE